MLRFHHCIFPAAIAVAASIASADVALNSLFGDGMVLQRDAECPMWGTAKPNVDVTASVAGKVVATSESRLDGTFRLTLPKLAAPGPYEIVVRAGDETTTLHDVLAGDVWLCGGQSNMQWTVNDSINGPAEVAAATMPSVRLFYVPRVASPTPLKSIDAHWTPCVPATVKDFSAVAYFFGRDLNRALNVPIGLIHSSWGGTPAESWTPLESLRTLSDLPAAQRLVARGEKEGTQDAFVQFVNESHAWSIARGHVDPGWSGDAATWMNTDFDDSGWKTVAAPADAIKQGVPAETIAWYRRAIDLPAGAAGKPGLLELSLVDGDEFAFVNGTVVGKASGAALVDPMNVARRYPIPAGLLVPGRNVIAVRVADEGLDGRSGFVGNANQMRVTLPAPSGQVPTVIPLAGPWRWVVERDAPSMATRSTTLPSRPKTLLRPDGPQFPGSLYNAMIAPLGDDAIKGVIWYQGESNADRASEYAKLLGTMIGEWREQFRDDALPFYIVGLANYRAAATQPVQSSEWGALREAQREVARDVKHVATTVTIDVGSATTIHPTDKQTVGQRLANVALAETYGDAGVPRSPTLKAATRGAGGEVIVTFDHVGGGLAAAGDKLASFTVAGADGVFHDADARIDGDRVTISSPDVAAPAVVRYAYADNPTPSLFNKERQPAAPFEANVE